MLGMLKPLGTTVPLGAWGNAPPLSPLSEKAHRASMLFACSSDLNRFLYTFLLISQYESPFVPGAVTPSNTYQEMVAEMHASFIYDTSILPGYADSPACHAHRDGLTGGG